MNCGKQIEMRPEFAGIALQYPGTPYPVEAWPIEGPALAHNAARVRHILEVIAAQAPADAMILCQNFAADFGTEYPVNFPAAIYIGKNCTLGHSMTIDAYTNPAGVRTKESGTPGFLLDPAGNTRFVNMRFDFRCHIPTEDGGGIGWNAPGDSSVALSNCELIARDSCDWLFYNWTPGEKTITAEDCTIRFVRQAFTMADGSGSRQTVIANRCKFYGDANGSQSCGASSAIDPITGAVLAPVVCRGGSVEMVQCHSRLVGLDHAYPEPYTEKYGCPRLVTLATDHYYSAAQRVDFEIVECTGEIGGTEEFTAEAYDLDARYGGEVEWRVKAGIGPNGLYSIRAT